MSEHTNHLIHETSPYLLQHARNPVDWYPWGKEAFALAKKENKPIFLSIGYSSCHWCHVMEEESFENEEIAALMNRLFVCIKVDREERPDIDQKYMRFVQMTTGSGGWPLTVFLTQDGEPFYGGTYFPAEDRYGKPGLKKLLPVVADYFHNNPQLQTDLQKIRLMLKSSDVEQQGAAIPDFDNWKSAVENLSGYYDEVNGGLGQAPKFPSTGVFDLFLRYFNHTKNNRFLEMTTHTLQRMAMGGIYDQLGGGFARYSVDARWLVPHFEKMLYDNAQLVDLYLATYQVTHDPFYLNIAQETLDFVLRELSDSNGGFYSSLDADSEGEEGKFYLWTKEEILQVLGPKIGNIFCERFGVTDQGNFHGRNILNVRKSFEKLAGQFNKSSDEIENIINQARQTLLEHRGKRVHPGLDYKVLTSWNGLMLSAFAHAYQITEKKRYAEVIQKNIDFFKAHLYRDGHLLHVFSKGQAKIPAFADDYAFYIRGLLDSYEALFDEDYLQMAVELSRTIENEFYDNVAGGYFYSSLKENESEAGDIKSEKDGSLPAASSVMIQNHLRLFSFTDDKSSLHKAETLLQKYGRQALENPFAFATYLQALDWYLNQPTEIVIFPTDTTVLANMRKVIFNLYLPNKVVLISKNSEEKGNFAGRSLLKGRKAVDGKTTVYVCVGQSCSLPVTDGEALRKLLERGSVK